MAFYSPELMPATGRGAKNRLEVMWLLSLSKVSAGIPDLAGVRRSALVSPGFVDEQLEIDAWAPAEEEFCFGVVEPSGMKGSFDRNRWECSRLSQVVSEFLVVNRFIHADVEGLLACLGVIDGFEDSFDKVADVDKIAFHRGAGGIKHHGYCAVLAVSIGALRTNQITPARAAEDVFAEGKGKFEIVLLHNPRSAETAAVQAVLNEILFEHHFFEDFGECVTAGIGGELLLFGDRDRMRIKEMADGTIAAQQNELLERGTDAALFEEPEQALYGDVHNVFGSFLAGCAV